VLIGVAAVLEAALGVLGISEKNRRSSGRVDAFTAAYITTSKSLRGRKGL